MAGWRILEITWSHLQLCETPFWGKVWEPGEVEEREEVEERRRRKREEVEEKEEGFPQGEV